MPPNYSSCAKMENNILIANDRFSPKRTLLPRRNSNFQGPLSAISGRRRLPIGLVPTGPEHQDLFQLMLGDPL